MRFGRGAVIPARERRRDCKSQCLARTSAPSRALPVAPGFQDRRFGVLPVARNRRRRRDIFQPGFGQIGAAPPSRLKDRRFTHESLPDRFRQMPGIAQANLERVRRSGVIVLVEARQIRQKVSGNRLGRFVALCDRCRDELGRP